MAARGNKNAVGNRGGGRKSLYKPEYSKQAYKLCLLGATDVDLGVFFEVSEVTINKWKKAHPEFNLALKSGKDAADAKVAEKLFNRATGYNCRETKINVVDNQIILTDIEKHYPPDPTSMIFWLKNRQRDKWSDVNKHEISSKEGFSLVVKRAKEPDNDNS